MRLSPVAGRIVCSSRMTKDRMQPCAPSERTTRVVGTPDRTWTFSGL
jgi:hypothetical protein